MYKLLNEFLETLHTQFPTLTNQGKNNKHLNYFRQLSRATRVEVARWETTAHTSHIPNVSACSVSQIASVCFGEWTIAFRDLYLACFIMASSDTEEVTYRKAHLPT